MSLKAFLKTLEGLDEKYHDLYEKTDEGYVLILDDKDYKNKIGEFRDNNINLNKELAKLKADLEKVKDIDPEKYRAGVDALAKMQEQADKDLLDAGKVEELIAQRTERMRSEYDGRITALTSKLEKLTGERDTLKTRLSDVVIDNEALAAAGAVGAIRKGARADVLSRAHSIWTLDEEGIPVPRRNGDVIYGKDGDKAMSMGEWAESLLTEAPFLFEGSKGGDAGGDQRRSSSTIPKGDPRAFGDNLEAIATGKVTVV